MKTVKCALKTRLASVSVLVLGSFLAPVSSMAQIDNPQGNKRSQVSLDPNIPNVVNPNETEFQRQNHFLSFVGSYIPESFASAKAYYKAIDPTNQKADFKAWLVNAGFISDPSQWHPYGPQDIRTGQPAGVYGDNIINTDSHVIVLNAADLGFVRNQFIRCKPSCSALNPTIYTYLENYPVAPFAASGSGFPFTIGYPTQDESKKAMNKAINRPLGDINGNNFCIGAANCLERIADVAFEWAPPAGATPGSSTRFGQLYSYIFSHDQHLITSSNPQGIVETIAFPDFLVNSPITGVAKIQDFRAGGFNTVTIQTGDPFAPNLDGVGFKQHPGVCLVCHGGAPTNLTSSGAYPRGGNINGFRFLPLDIRNLLFTSDLDTTDPLSRI